MYNHGVTGVSVIICCYNSASRIAATLKHIALQKVPVNILWEVIIVDNNSADNIKNAVQHEWEQYNVPVSFKVVEELKPGLIHARKKGASTAMYDLLLFCDDDNWLAEDYIHSAYQIMAAHENVAVLGGSAEGSFESKCPGWFDKFEKAYAIGKPMPQSGIANERSYIAGAGMVIRKYFFQLFEEASFKYILTGRKGKELLAGEDSEICLMVLFLGYDLYYDDTLHFTHYMPQNRLTWNYCVEMIGKGHAIPQLYLDIYRYCNIKLSEGDKPDFEEIYKKMKSAASRKFIRKIVSSKPFWLHFSMLIKPVPGSKDEIELKSYKNKFLFLLKNEKHLKETFVTIQQNLVAIKQSHRHSETVV